MIAKLINKTEYGRFIRRQPIISHISNFILEDELIVFVMEEMEVDGWNWLKFEYDNNIYFIVTAYNDNIYVEVEYNEFMYQFDIKSIIRYSGMVIPPFKIDSREMANRFRTLKMLPVEWNENTSFSIPISTYERVAWYILETKNARTLYFDVRRNFNKFYALLYDRTDRFKAEYTNKKDFHVTLGGWEITDKHQILEIENRFLDAQL